MSALEKPKPKKKEEVSFTYVVSEPEVHTLKKTPRNTLEKYKKNKRKKLKNKNSFNSNKWRGASSYIPARTIRPVW